jgi:hypothetical protein
MINLILNILPSDNSDENFMIFVTCLMLSSSILQNLNFKKNPFLHREKVTNCVEE